MCVEYSGERFDCVVNRGQLLTHVRPIWTNTRRAGRIFFLGAEFTYGNAHPFGSRRPAKRSNATLEAE